MLGGYIKHHQLNLLLILCQSGTVSTFIQRFKYNNLVNPKRIHASTFDLETLAHDPLQRFYFKVNAKERIELSVKFLNG